MLEHLPAVPHPGPTAAPGLPVLAEAAYRVPWRVERSLDPWFAIVNEGSETVNGVHLLMNGDGRLLWRPLLTVAPGERVSFVIRADDPARDCIACVRWFRPDGSEYLWRVSF